jgi:hypothetical protein
MIKADDEDPDDRVGNAIELAIIGNAKRFIKSNAAQRVINSIWRFTTSLPGSVSVTLMGTPQRQMRVPACVHALYSAGYIQAYSSALL